MALPRQFQRCSLLFLHDMKKNSLFTQEYLRYLFLINILLTPRQLAHYYLVVKRIEYSPVFRVRRTENEKSKNRFKISIFHFMFTNILLNSTPLQLISFSTPHNETLGGSSQSRSVILSFASLELGQSSQIEGIIAHKKCSSTAFNTGLNDYSSSHLGYGRYSHYSIRRFLDLFCLWYPLCTLQLL